MTQAPSHTPPATGGAGQTLGVIAIVCGGVGICIPGMALVGLVLGVLGLMMSTAGHKKLPGIGTGVSGVTLLLNLALLVLILMPALRAARQAADMQRELSNLSQIGVAFTAYSIDNKGRHPEHASDVVNAGYVQDLTIFTAPPADPAATALPAMGGDPTKPYTYGSFTFTALAGFAVFDLREPSNTIIAYSDQPRGVDGGYRAVLFADGHTEMVPETEFPQRLSEHQRNIPSEDRRRLSR